MQMILCNKPNMSKYRNRHDMHEKLVFRMHQVETRCTSPARSRDLLCAAAYSGVLRPPQLNPASHFSRATLFHQGELDLPATPSQVVALPFPIKSLNKDLWETLLYFKGDSKKSRPATWCYMVNAFMWCLPSSVKKEWCVGFHYRNDKERYTFQWRKPLILQLHVDTDVSLTQFCCIDYYL